MPTWVWIAHAASPDELQATVNAFLRALHAHGGEVVDVDYEVMARDAVGPKAFYSLCLSYRGSLSPHDLLAAPDSAPG